MAVFFKTGGGDIYGGKDRAAVEAAMLADCADVDLTEIEEVDGQTKVIATDENDMPTDELITLADEFGDSNDAYIVSSENW